MNEIIKFIKEHPHCTKWTCSTCGGFWIFIFELDSWKYSSSPELLGSFQQILPSDLIDIVEWRVYFEQILTKIPEADRESSVYPSWWVNFGKDLTYDLFAIQHAPSVSYDLGRDDTWIRQDIRYIVKKNLEREVKPLVCFLENEIDRYPELNDYLTYVNRRNQIEREKEAIIRAEREAERVRLEKRKTEISEQFSANDSGHRLLEILEEPGFPISLIPEKWEIITDDQLTGWNSYELSSFIKLLNQKMYKNDAKRWKDLRRRLYLLRQRVYNQEKGYPKKSA